MIESSAHLIKVGREGKVILTIPDMIGQYILIRQTDDNLIISPYGVDSAEEHEAVVQHGLHATMIGSSQKIPPAV